MEAPYRIIIHHDYMKAVGGLKGDNSGITPEIIMLKKYQILQNSKFNNEEQHHIVVPRYFRCRLSADTKGIFYT